MEIGTARLLLREFRADDWRALGAYQSTLAYLRYYPIEQRPAEESKAFVDTVRGWAEEQPRTKFQLAITLPDHDLVIGCCGVRKPDPESEDGELGCELDPTYWGFGYAVEASRAMLAFAFTELGVRRIRAHIVEENTRAVRLAEKLGLQPEGKLDEPTRVEDRLVDTLVYAAERGG